MKKIYDYVLIGTGPGSSSWLRSILKRNENARIAVLEKGPFNKTDILTERNPFAALHASRTMVTEYEHEVMQGSCLGGGTGVNNYAWVTPSENDLNNYDCAEGVKNVNLECFHDLCENLAYKGPIHPLHNLMTQHAHEKFDLNVRSNYKSRVHEVNRGHVHLGTPTIDNHGIRRSAYSAVMEPLLRKHHGNVNLFCDTECNRVLFEKDKAVGVVDVAGQTYEARKAVVVGAGCLETPALLMRSGIGCREMLRDSNIDVLVDNSEVGQNLRDKMLTDDMIITNSKLSGFDKSLFLMNIILSDGASIQLHRYDKLTFGNTYLALTRLIRGNGLLSTSTYRNILKYATPTNVFCFQTYFKMKSSASITLNKSNLSAQLNADALFEEAKRDKEKFRTRLNEMYGVVDGMKSENLKYTYCVPDIRADPSKHMRLVWHFAGSCASGKVVDPDRAFEVLGTKNLHIVDNSVLVEPPDGGAQPTAYLTGYLAGNMMQI